MLLAADPQRLQVFSFAANTFSLLITLKGIWIDSFNIGDRNKRYLSGFALSHVIGSGGIKSTHKE